MIDPFRWFAAILLVTVVCIIGIALSDNLVAGVILLGAWIIFILAAAHAGMHHIG